MSELGSISDQIAADLRTVFSIGYYPTNDKKDGSYRRVQVKMLGDAKLTARTRAGYYANK
jgi:Ca-activated chloride channel family protein